MRDKAALAGPPDSGRLLQPPRSHNQPTAPDRIRLFAPPLPEGREISGWRAGRPLWAPRGATAQQGRVLGSRGRVRCFSRAAPLGGRLALLGNADLDSAIAYPRRAVAPTSVLPVRACATWRRYAGTRIGGPGRAMASILSSAAGPSQRCCERRATDQAAERLATIPQPRPCPAVPKPFSRMAAPVDTKLPSLAAANGVFPEERGCPSMGRDRGARLAGQAALPPGSGSRAARHVHPGSGSRAARHAAP